jgi:hypothetical protein
MYFVGIDDYSKYFPSSLQEFLLLILQSLKIKRDPYPKLIISVYYPTKISAMLFMHLHLMILFSKIANRKLFLFPSYEVCLLINKSEKPPNTLLFVA